MSNQRTIRRLAMQALYQFDVRGEADREAILDSLRDDARPADLAEPAFALALDAWAHHQAADAIATELAPDWPTHRQPPVDRAILRLAHGEIVTGRTPVKVAINEAVELAKQFGAEHSPSFINGVLDKMARRIKPQTPSPDADPEAPTSSPSSAPSPSPSSDNWLADAMRDRDGDKP